MNGSSRSEPAGRTRRVSRGRRPGWPRGDDRPAVRSSCLRRASNRCRRPPASSSRACFSSSRNVDQYVSSYSSTIWNVHRPARTLRPTSSVSSRSASRVVPGLPERGQSLAELDVGGTGQLVERVEVPAGTLAGLQRLRQLAQRLDGGVVDARRRAVVGIRQVLRRDVGHRGLLVFGRRFGAVVRVVRVLACRADSVPSLSQVMVGSAGRSIVPFGRAAQFCSGPVGDPGSAIRVSDPRSAVGVRRAGIRQARRSAFWLSGSAGGGWPGADERPRRRAGTACWPRSRRSCPRTRTTGPGPRRRPPTPGCGWPPGPGTSDRGR